MRAMDLIWFACFRVFLRTLKPKQRFKFLQDVSELIGEPGVIPLIKPEAAVEVSRARGIWVKFSTDMARAA